VLGGALALAVAAPVAAETPKDTVVMAKQIDDLISLDPAEVFEFSGGEVVGNVYEALLDFNVNKVSELRGRLAESWGVAVDGKTYTFKLRKGVKFASGNPIAADDVVWSLQRAIILNKAPGFILTQFGFTKDNIKERITRPTRRQWCSSPRRRLRRASSITASPPMSAPSSTARPSSRKPRTAISAMTG